MTGGTLHIPVGSLVSGPCQIELTVERAGWLLTAPGVLALEARESALVDTGEEQILVLPWEGSWRAACGGDRFEVARRKGVLQEAAGVVSASGCARMRNRMSALDCGSSVDPGATNVVQAASRLRPTSPLTSVVRSVASRRGTQQLTLEIPVDSSPINLERSR